MIHTYTLTEKTSFTLDVEDWRMVLMEAGDEVKIDEGEVYIRVKGQEDWHKTIDMVSAHLLARLEIIH